MFDIAKKLFGKPQYVSQTDTRGNDPEPDPNDIWIFTDPDAKETYLRKDAMKKLEHDIRFEIMRGEPWLPMELEYKNEIRRLLREGIIRDKGTYWYTSPHPTVYKANRSGQLNVGDTPTRFSKGEELVFQCRMTREMNKLSVPFIASTLESTKKTRLCGEMSTSMMGMGGKEGKQGMKNMKKM